MPADDIPHAPVPLRRAGRSGLDLPAVSLGLWQNFGDDTAFAAQRDLVLHAVDRGLVHLDLANNYGPPAGAAERSVGRLLATDLRGHRDELVIATKAGYRGWPGPYGEGSSRKNLLASLDRSLRHLGTDHVDVFYSHRFDPSTPLEETVGALETAVRSGRALYVGISSYSAARTREALAVARDLGLALTLHQSSYAMVNRWVERPDEDGHSVLGVAADAGMGLVAFSPLAQGLLTATYLHGVPATSRAARDGSFKRSFLTPEVLASVRALAALADERGEPLARTALAWCLRQPAVTSVVVGARTVAQLDENLGALSSAPFTDEELARIDDVAIDAGVNIWAARSSDL